VAFRLAWENEESEYFQGEVVVSLRLIGAAGAEGAGDAVGWFIGPSAGRPLKFLFDDDEESQGGPLFVELLGEKLTEMVLSSAKESQGSINFDPVKLLLDRCAKIAKLRGFKCIDLTKRGEVRITPDEPILTFEARRDHDRYISIADRLLLEEKVSAWIGVLSAALPDNVSVGQVDLFPGDGVFSSSNGRDVVLWIEEVSRSNQTGRLGLSSVSVGEPRAVVWFISNEKNEVVSLLVCQPRNDSTHQLERYDREKWVEAELVQNSTECVGTALEFGELSSDVVRDSLKDLKIGISEKICDDLVAAFAHRVIEHPSQQEVAREVVRAFYRNEIAPGEESSAKQEPFLSQEQVYFREWLNRQREVNEADEEE
jgi:hypothetical protein